MTVEETWAQLRKYEEIAENTLRKHGRVPDSLAKKLSLAQMNYAIAKDDRNDPSPK